MTVTAMLAQAGWVRIEDPSHRQSCGMPGPTSGFCERNARWKEHQHAQPMCAQHAAELAGRRSTK